MHLRADLVQCPSRTLSSQTASLTLPRLPALQHERHQDIAGCLGLLCCKQLRAELH